MKKILYIVLSLMLVSCNATENATNNYTGNQSNEPETNETSVIVTESDKEPTDDQNNYTGNLQNEDTVDLKSNEGTEISEEIPLPSIYDSNFEPAEYEIVEAFPNLRFNRPLYLSGGGDENDNIYVVEKKGIIWIFPNNPKVEQVDVYLDITDRVASVKNEDGLLGLAFHPELENQPYVYVYYTDKGGSVISRFELNTGIPVEANPDSELVLMRYKQPYSNHNGGHLAFGEDGYLYISSGDGGSAGDPQNNGQNLQNSLGKILRIDVNNISEEETYHIPSDNPFVGNDMGYREEIFAYGLRNPWRFSFDAERKILLAADVGQDRIEEIDIIVSGGNYGWAKYEGTKEYKNIELQGVSEAIMPVLEYEHPVGESVTGGYTYYGSVIPSLYGTYIYGDFISGRIWGLWLDESNMPTNVELVNSSLKIASFGLDDQGEIYIVDYNGKIYKIVEK